MAMKLQTKAFAVATICSRLQQSGSSVTLTYASQHEQILGKQTEECPEKAPRRVSLLRVF